MTRLILSRLAQLPLILLVIYTVTLALAWLVPGNPLENAEGRQPPPEVAEQMKRQYNLDSFERFYVTYLDNATGFRYARDWASGDLAEAREDWAILRALSEVLGHTLPFDSLTALRAALYDAYPHFAAIDEIEPADGAVIAKLGAKPGKMNKSAFASPVKDFYLTNPIARASAVMAECSQLAKNATPVAAE